MGAWHSTFTDLMRSRYSALIAYAGLLVEDGLAARELADRAVAEVFARRRSPHDIGAAEVAAREWMAGQAVADGAPAARVVAVLIAIDGRDADQVHAVLKGATPDPLPDVTPDSANEVRRRFSETAAVYATPSGGNAAVMAPAKRRRRSALTGAGVGTVAAVAVVGVAAYAGVNFLPSSFLGAAPSASPSPSPTVLAVTWNPQPDITAAMEGFVFPACGEDYAPAAQAVADVTATPSMEQFDDDADSGVWIMLNSGFTSTNKERSTVLANGNLFVITLDDKVVWSPGNQFNGVDIFVANSTGANNGGAGLARSSLCDADVARDALAKKFDGLDWDNITPEQQAKVDKAWATFQKDWSVFTPGTYKIYQVSPVIFGEQAALAQAFLNEGISSLNGLEHDISWSELSRDPIVAPYCTGSWDVGDWQCNPPPEVLREILTRDVDPGSIDDTPGGVAISEPLVYEVE